MSHLIIDRRGGIAVLTMDRVDKRNAIDPGLSRELENALNDVEDDRGVRCTILTGGDAVFSAGSDLHNPRGSTLMERGGEYGLIRRQRTKPLVAAVEGAAYGGGFEVALACDMIVAARDARFALPEARRGTLAASGALFRGPRALPVHIARELLLTGLPLAAERAFQIGLVNRLTEPGTALAGALELAEAVQLSSPVTVRATLEALSSLESDSDAAGWAATEAAFEVIDSGADEQEGIAAFFERRPPRWH